MSEEKRLILEKINKLIDKRADELRKGLLAVHEIEDGIIIRFFTEWDECVNNIKYKKIINNDDPNDTTIFYFIPKGAVIDLKKRPNIHSIACISGKVEIKTATKTQTLTAFRKMDLDNSEFEGVGLEDTYVITNSRSAFI